MKKYLLILALILVCLPCNAQVMEWISGGIPRPVSDGWPMPVSIGSGTTITIGSSTFTSSPVWADDAGSGTLGLTDSFRRPMVNIASDAVGLNASLATVSLRVETLRAQQATETINVLEAVATTSLRVETLRAQQATETLNVLAAIASSTLAATGTHPITIDQTIPGVTNAVQDRVLLVASTTMGTFTTAVYSIPLVASAQEIVIYLTGTNKEAWLTMGGDNPSVGNGVPIRDHVTIGRLNGSEIIEVTASETLGACWIQR